MERHRRHDRTRSARVEQPEGSQRDARHHAHAGLEERENRRAVPCASGGRGHFTNIEVDVTVTGRYYTIPAAAALDYGVHYWRVQAADALGNWGGWSTPFQFALTNMTSPKDGTTTTSTRPTFEWAAVSGAVEYHFELADNEDFISPVETYTGPNRSYRPVTPLAAGLYYWHVNVDGGDWMPTWTIVITPAKPGRPALSSPANRTILGDNTPTFEWLAATNGNTYQIQVDDNGDFSSPEQDVTVGVGLLSYVADELADAKYYWHVRAINTTPARGARSGISRWIRSRRQYPNRSRRSTKRPAPTRR